MGQRQVAHRRVEAMPILSRGAVGVSWHSAYEWSVRVRVLARRLAHFFRQPDVHELQHAQVRRVTEQSGDAAKVGSNEAIPHRTIQVDAPHRRTKLDVRVQDFPQAFRRICARDSEATSEKTAREYEGASVWLFGSV